MLGQRKSHKQPLIPGSSTRTDTNFNLPRPSVFCPNTEATAQAIILRANLSAVDLEDAREKKWPLHWQGNRNLVGISETRVSSNFSHSYFLI